jgi:hypothetical protein
MRTMIGPATNQPAITIAHRRWPAAPAVYRATASGTAAEMPGYPKTQ